jgi:hypothetical protein
VSNWREVLAQCPNFGSDAAMARASSIRSGETPSGSEIVVLASFPVRSKLLSSR